MRTSIMKKDQDGNTGGSSVGDLSGEPPIYEDENEDSSSDEENHEGTSTEDEYQEMRAFAKDDTRRINAIKLMVVTIILCVGAALSAFTYIILKRQSEKDIMDSFNLFASTIEENSKFRISTMFSASRALSRSITTSSFTATDKFPYLSIPSWEAKAYESRTQAGFETVTYAPINLRLDRWVEFSQSTRNWLNESKLIYDDLEPGSNRSSEPPIPPLPNAVWDYDSIKLDGSLVERTKKIGIMATTLHVSPPPLPSVEIYQNVNMLSHPDYYAVSNACVKLKDAVFSAFSPILVDGVNQLIGIEAHEKAHLYGKDPFLYPHSIAAQPVYRGLSSESDDVVAYVYSVVAWDRYLHKLLPEGVVGIVVVLRNSCGQAVTYELQGEEAIVVANHDTHDSAYDSQSVTVDFTENYLDPALAPQVEGHCQVFLDVYPSKVFEDSHYTNLPVALTLMVAILFIIMAASFCLYDWFVQSRNDKVVGVAARSNAIVAGLFPSAVKDRLMEEQLKKERNKGPGGKNGYTKSLRGYLSNREDEALGKAGKTTTPPIADFYPNTTILFSDLAGFTAWSSSREPSQVFTLLETIYNEFDRIAKRRNIFKVETIGDCYVAVCGLPDPRKDHAQAMCRFAREAMHATWNLTAELTTTLGPDTGDLTMRMGIHSGPITAGVLRGDKGRFQLFGDTMNTASRMESNGTRSRIQISQATADLLGGAGKSSWFNPRADKIEAKGKGELQTYWLTLSDASETASNSTGSLRGSDDSGALYKKCNAPMDENSRLVSWSVEMLCPLLKQILATRKSKQQKPRKWKNGRPLSNSNTSIFEEGDDAEEGAMVLDEVSDVITFHDSAAGLVIDPNSVQLSAEVVKQLRTYIGKVAAMYHDNPFHNFEHASHVTMSVQKLLGRIVAPGVDEDLASGMRHSCQNEVAQAISNPLTQFACVLSGVIHDLDHPGVPNTQLVKEGTVLAEHYNGRSVAEQHSVNQGWDLLMTDEFKELRSTIYANEEEKKHFRSVVVNSVMATDVMDKTLKKERNLRWDKAFNDSLHEESNEARDRQATIVIEHLIQASDISHTMQHWHVYMKWNTKLFIELYVAFREGRAEKNPAEFWYLGEIGFLEGYVIPLAKKLKDCGVFGVSSDEYLNYAEQNLLEWKSKGGQVVAEMVEKAKARCDERDRKRIDLLLS